MKLGILISGRGSNMTAIVEAVQSGLIPDSEVTVVISDKKARRDWKRLRSAELKRLLF